LSKGFKKYSIFGKTIANAPKLSLGIEKLQKI
jgi:hypothetical protein